MSSETQVQTQSSAVEQLNASFNALRETYADLDSDALATPDVVGFWTPKDVVAHTAYWTTAEAEGLEARASGTEHSGDDLGWEAINEREYELRKDWSAEQAVSALDAAHERLIATVSAQPDVTAEDVKGTIEHYDEHAAELRAWRESRA